MQKTIERQIDTSSNTKYFLGAPNALNALMRLQSYGVTAEEILKHLWNFKQ